MTTVLLVRHGQTDSNVMGALDTQLPGAELNALGHRQAADLVARLDGQRVDRIVTSRHDRARQTAQPLAADRSLTITQDAGFGEIAAGDVEMGTSDEAKDVYLDTAYAWSTGDAARRMPGGETGEETLARFDDALARALDGLDDDATLVVVSHGAMLRLWLTTHTDGITPEDARGRKLPNTTVLRIEGSPGEWHFRSWDEPRLRDLGADDPTAEADAEDE